MRALGPAVCISVLAALCAARAGAQEPLTLATAIDAALAAHPSVTAATQATVAANERRRDAKSALAPRIGLEESWQRTDQPVLVFGSLLAQRRFTVQNFAIDALNHPSPLSNHRFGIGVDQLLFDGGRTTAGIRAAGARTDAAAADESRARADLALDVSHAFARALSAGGALRTARAASDTAAADLALVSDRRNTGLETDAAFLLAQERTDRAAAAAVAAAAEDEIARAALNSLMGAPLNGSYALVPPEPDLPADADIQRLTAAALETRPEVLRAIDAERAAEAAVTEARRALEFPSVRAMATLEGNGPTFTDRSSAWTAGVVAQWSISSAGGDGARIRAATAELEAAHAQRRAAESAVALDVFSAVARARAASARERATRRVVDDAREAQRITRNRYEAGLAPATELARTAEQVAAAESLRTSTLADAVVAVAELDHATGKGATR